MSKPGYFYILASDYNGTLYAGVTSNLVARVWQHKNKTFPGFTSKHDVSKLVYYEAFDEIYYAIEREHRVKKWNRKWKIRLIEKDNPDWNDLYEQVAYGWI